MRSCSSTANVRETDAARDAAELLDENDVFEVAEAETAKVRRGSGAEKTGVAELGPKVLRES